MGGHAHPGEPTAVLSRRCRRVVATVAALVVSGAMALGGGCAHQPYRPGTAADANERDQQAGPAPLFAYDSGPDYHNDTVGQHEDPAYEVRRIRFASVGDNGQPGDRVVGHWLRHEGSGPRRLVIVLPIWGLEDVYPVRKTARGIASRVPNTDVFWLRGPEQLVDWSRVAEAETEEAFHQALARFVERLRVNVVDIRRIIDWAEQQPGIDSGRIGIVGFSIGAIVASVAVANEPRLRAAVLAMGAAEPGRVLATCNGAPGQARERIMDRFGWSTDRYREAVSLHFAPLRAATRAPRTDPGRLLIFDARLDGCIPRESQDALWERMGRPERVSIFAGHKLAFLAMTPLGLNSMSSQIYRFFDEKL